MHFEIFTSYDLRQCSIQPLCRVNVFCVEYLTACSRLNLYSFLFISIRFLLFFHLKLQIMSFVLITWKAYFVLRSSLRLCSQLYHDGYFINYFTSVWITNYFFLHFCQRLTVGLPNKSNSNSWCWSVTEKLSWNDSYGMKTFRYSRR